MKRIFALTLAIVASLVVVSNFAQEAQSPASKTIANMKFPDLHWKVPEVGKEVIRTELPNGMILYFLEDHSLPLVNADVIIRTGSAYEPKGQMAIAGITGSVMRSGGTKLFTPDSLNTLLEYISGSVESSIGLESGSASMSVLSKDLDVGLKILNEVLRYPIFNQDKIDLEKSQIKESIRRRNDRPGGILYREFAHLLYGDHPYGRIMEWDDVKNISRDDLVAYHDKYYHPNSVMMAFSGDFDSKVLLKKIQTIFGDWKKSDITLPPIPEVVYAVKPGVFVINKQVTQSNITMGELGIKRDNPDRYAIALMNYTLGGGSFTSRLTSKVRSDEGLAYSVGSSFNISSRDYGTFQASTQTKTATTYRALELFKQEIEKMRVESISQAEFETARDSYLNNFVFQFDSPSEVVERLMNLEYDGYPADYYKNYINNIQAVTIADIKRVAGKYLHPDQMTIMIVTDTSKVVGNLSDFGKVEYIPLQEPKVD